MKSFWRRLKYLFLPSYRRREESEMRDELDSLRTIAGRKELGNLTQAAENARQVLGWNWLDGLGQDLRYACRTAIRHRRLSFVALLSLAVGIGANTLVFTLVSTMIFRPMPYPEPERLVKIIGLTGADCVAVKERVEIFEHVGCHTDPVSASLADLRSVDASSQRIRGLQLSAGAAQALGIQPKLGRWFTEKEEQDGSDSVLLISFSLWQRRFSGSGDAIGRVVRLDGEPATIIGVTPDEFEFVVPNADFWKPLRRVVSGPKATVVDLDGVARLKAGVSVSTSAQAVAGTRPRVEVRELERADIDILADTGDYLLVLQGVVGFVLMIACANVAGLLLAQGSTRQKEMALRTALGSGRWRIFRQSLIYSAVLSAGGGILGLVFGSIGVRVLTNTLPAGLPRTIYTMQLDMGVFALTAGISAVCAFLVGVVPALQISHANPLDAMRESGRTATSGFSRQRLRSAFVAGQVALAFVLLVAAGLMINSLVRLANVPLGFDPDNLVTLQIQLPEGKFPQVFHTTEDIRQKLALGPGVAGVGGIAIYPPLSGAMNMPVRFEGMKTEEPERAQFLPILPDYFKTLQVKIVAGREFLAGDTAANVPVAVINTAMARKFWPNESPLGKQLQIDTPLMSNHPSREIIGVVDEIMQYAGQDSRPQLYLPYAQLPEKHDVRLSADLRSVTFVIRTSLPLTQVIPSMRAAVAAADSSQAISEIQSMRDTAFHSLERRRVFVGLLGTFAFVAIALAMIGVYGVMAQVVAQRTNEIGIRIALGADAKQVRSLILRRGGLLIGIGLFAGVLVALALTRVLRSALFGVGSSDPATFATGAVLLGSIALLACYLPARRASRIDPNRALRHD
jgi:predicted permease